MRPRGKLNGDGGHDGFLRWIRGRGSPGAAGEGPGSGKGGDQLDWPLLMERLGVARHRWDLGVLCNLDEEEGRRPADLLADINSRSAPRQLSAQVLSVRLRALERDEFVRHEDQARIPLQRVYFLLPAGRAKLQTLRAVAPWDERMPDRRSGTGAAR
jgi:DNA-binding HxlR family transcriptional regulator